MLCEIKFHYPLQHADKHFQPKISQCPCDSFLKESLPGVVICSSASPSCREVSAQYTIKHMLITLGKSHLTWTNVCCWFFLSFFFLKLIFFVVKIMMLVSSRLDKVLFFLLELLDERHLGT